MKSLVYSELSGHPFLSRIRYKLALASLLGVVVPMVLAMVTFGTGLSDPNQINTAIGAALALLVGFVAFRRLHIFPGITAGGYVVASITGSFCLLVVALVLLRVEYSRVQLTVSYLLTLIFFTYVHLRVDARQVRFMGVVPGGATSNLPVLPLVRWVEMVNGENIKVPLEGIVADLNFDHSKEWDDEITRFALEGIPVFHVKQAIEQLTGRVEIEHLSENPLGSLNPNNIYLKVKSVADAIAALLLLIGLLPLMVVLGIAIRMDSPGPALFRQRRIGFRSTPFTVYKFRTMRVASVGEDEAAARTSAITQVNDSRITRIGAVLRRTRLDELPQLINILRGEMSIIGPRPEAEALSQWYTKEISFYRYRHIIRPGLTGWAQINQGHVANVDEVREKLHLDFYYIKNFSIWLDILIALKTIHIMITGHGSR